MVLNSVMCVIGLSILILPSGEFVRISTAECQFAYRDGPFSKAKLRNLP